MVDWSLDTTTLVNEPRAKNDINIGKQPRKRGPFGVRKSKPLVDNGHHHVTYSGRNQRKATTKVRKAKRDSAGNVVRQ
ncbi:MAG TPA: hypothetical protein HA354_04780 [Candidatus Poseidoniaceae archaeon]|nr:hypothetical protein [Euryarchaeota archaeon]DAC57814.1 MAG TPA: hypothetical protein D7I07_04765 [Candidatus Poseidoniales archaeon]HII37793.1 hypothetical protein [Candidatus Poseidoniaceae archaeon]